jgi:regulation of enolase protein 1 (concanavalin A-like superfamily)
MPRTENSFWRNEPLFHERRGESLVVRTGLETDYWNNTFYGFRHLSGHFLATPVSGDFSLLTTFTAQYETLYDQAGAMVFVDDNNWLKCGVEFTDGALHFSVVVTRDDQSDWSMMPLSSDPKSPVTLRVTRHAEALRVQVLDGTLWRLVRLCYLRMPETVEVGPMTCSPLREGLETTFHTIEIGEPISRELH